VEPMETSQSSNHARTTSVPNRRRKEPRKQEQISNLRSGWMTKLALVVLALLVMAASAPLGGAQSNVKGQWKTLPAQMPLNPVHVTLLANGKILVVAGSGNYPAITSFQAGVWDPATNTMAIQSLPWDMFCNGMVTLPDGRVLISGGNLAYDPFHGWQRNSIFDPVTGKFTDVEDMAHGRWYPTTTELSDGRIVSFGGLNEVGNTNSQVEIYQAGGGWSTPYNASWVPPLYPRLHLLPSGKLFYSGLTTQSRTFDPVTHTWSGVIATTNYAGGRTYGSSVMFPLTPANNYKPKVMIFGGGNPSTATTEIIDLSAATPNWIFGPPMSKPRIEMNATMLPNGKIVTIGGSLNDEDATTASLAADLYDTTTNTMSSAGSNAFPRLYHSVSLLLPDATVWVAGGNPQRGTYEQHIEIYTPPYLFNADGSPATRPTITSVTPGVVGYGSTFQVQTPDAASIGQVVLMRPGSPTHAFDMDQRMVGLSFAASSGSLTVSGPPSAGIAPPGYYMVFLINTAGVPSVAKFVQVSPAPAVTPPTGTITSPATDIKIPPGGIVNFAGTGTSVGGTITGYSWVIRGASPATSSAANTGGIAFTNPGVYTAMLTVTDNNGVTDPSPPTRTITVSSSPAPTVSSATPNSTPQGSTLNVGVSGTNFLAGAACNFGADILINSCNLDSAMHITANVTVIASALGGARNIIVTNTDGQSGTLAGGFVVQGGAGNPSPTISSVAPNTGLVAQSNLTVVVTGNNFLQNPNCDFGLETGITTNSCTYNSPTQITANISVSSTAALGSRNVTVIDTDGQSATLVNGFAVVVPPAVTHIDFTYPDRASLLAGGWSFLATTAGGATRNTEVTPGPPAADYNQTTHPGVLRVQLGSGEMYGSSNNSQNTLFRALPPNWISIRLKVAAFNPNANYQQIGLLLYQNDDNYVLLDRVYANTPSIETNVEIAQNVTRTNRLSLTNTTNLILRIDKNSTNNYSTYYSVDGGNVWTLISTQTAALTNPKLGIQPSTDQSGTFPPVDLAWVEIESAAPLPTPTIASVSPASGLQGQGNINTTVTGTNFLSGATCSFGAGLTVNSCTFVSATQLAASVSVTQAATAGTRNVVVTNVDGQSAVLLNGFTVSQNPSPTLTTLNPNTGSQGQNNIAVTLLGTGFLGGATCNFGAGITVNSCTVSSSTLLIANVSVATNAVIGSNSVSVTNFDGKSATLPNSFAITAKVVYPTPALTSATPNTAIQGQASLNVVLAGANFLTAPSCTFGTGITVNSCVYNSATQITANISVGGGAAVGARNVAVVNSDGQTATLAGGFTVTQNTTGLTHIDFSYPDRASLLAGGWSYMATTASGGSRNTEVLPGPPAADYNQNTHPGVLRVQLGAGEMYGASNNSQNSLFHALPPNWTSIRLKVAAFNPTANYQQLGLLLYQNDDQYILLDRVYAGAPYIETNVETSQSVNRVNRLPLTNTGNLILRIDKNSANNYSTYYSTDGGNTWTTVSTQTVSLVNPTLGIQPSTDLSGSFPTVDLAWVEIQSPGPLPAPLLQSVTPNSAVQSTNSLAVTMAGNNFLPGPVCNFGAGITVNSCVYNSANQITANISVSGTATVGTRNVTVTNSDGQSSSLTGGFTIQQAVVLPAPTLSSAAPDSGTQAQSGLSVVLTGLNFQNGPSCSFGAGITVNSCTMNSSSQITAILSVASNATVGVRSISVTNADGQSATLAGGFTVNATTANITHMDFSYSSRAALLAAGWSYTATKAAGGTRNTEVTTGSPTVDFNQATHPGAIRMQLGSGEIYSTANNSQNTLFYSLPAAWTSIRLNVASFNPTANYQQLGLMVYQDDDNYLHLDRLYANSPSIEAFTEVATGVSYVSRSALTNTGNLILRIDRTSANNYTSYYSTDGGTTWTNMGSTGITLTNAKLGIEPSTDLTGTFPTVDISWVEIWQ